MAAIDGNLSGPMDRTLRNMSLAHYNVFGTWPSFSLSADVLNDGEIHFETQEEAERFFNVVKTGFEGSGQGNDDAVSAGLHDAEPIVVARERFEPRQGVVS